MLIDYFSNIKVLKINVTIQYIINVVIMFFRQEKIDPKSSDFNILYSKITYPNRFHPYCGLLSCDYHYPMRLLEAKPPATSRWRWPPINHPVLFPSHSVWSFFCFQIFEDNFNNKNIIFNLLKATAVQIKGHRRVTALLSPRSRSRVSTQLIGDPILGVPGRGESPKWRMRGRGTNRRNSSRRDPSL